MEPFFRAFLNPSGEIRDAIFVGCLIGVGIHFILWLFKRMFIAAFAEGFRRIIKENPKYFKKSTAN